MIVEEFESRGGQAHGGPGVPAIGCIDRIDGQEANRVLNGFS
jgi:hypothetical protein